MANPDAGTSKDSSKRIKASPLTSITIKAGDGDDNRETAAAGLLSRDFDDRKRAVATSSSSQSKKKKTHNNGHHGRIAQKEDDNEEHEAVLHEKDETKAATKKIAVAQWKMDDLVTLIHNIEANLPKRGNRKYSTQILRVDWKQVCFRGHGSEECKAKWTEIMTKIRRFRTLAEVIQDAKQWAKEPWTTFSTTKSKHPDLPKKPLTSYLRFFVTKRKLLSERYPELSVTDLTKTIAKRYAVMSAKRKQKYRDLYERENENYKVEISKFKMKHPDLYREGDAANKSRRGPAKPQAAVHLFMTKKMSKHATLDPEDKKEKVDRYKARWKNLSDEKRVRWIRKVSVTEQQYNVELAKFRLDNSDYEVDDVKSVITKAEKAILDRFDGKPDKPPNSGYWLYSKVMLKEIADMPAKEKMTEISRRWKELSAKERNSYKKQVIAATEKYKRDLAKYWEGLREKGKKLLEASLNGGGGDGGEVGGDGGGGEGGGSSRGNNKDVAKDVKARGQSKLKNQRSALFLYQQKKMTACREKLPDKSQQEVIRHLAREFGELSDNKKDKYKRLAEDARKENAAQVKSKVSKYELFKGEPEMPPQSGYLLFTSTERKGRMAEILRRWKMLSLMERQKYKATAAKLRKKYRKEHLAFIFNLSSEDRPLYVQHKMKKGGGGSVTAKPNSPINKPMQVAVVDDNASSDLVAGDN